MKVKPLSLIFLLFFFVLAALTPLQAQDEEEEEEYDREFVWGINKNTNGGYIGGLNIKFSGLVSPGLYRTYGFEVVNVKDPKEERYQSRFGGGAFIRGKINYLYALRFSVGMEKVMFKKGPQQGVQINLLSSVGPTIGLVSPYYVEFSDNNGSNSSAVPYDPKEVNISSIYGPGRPLQGLDESKIVPGLHARAGVSFEFGTFKSNVSGLEIGVMTEGYLKEVQLMATPDGRWFWPSAYITLFHGRRR